MTVERFWLLCLSVMMTVALRNPLQEKITDVWYAALIVIALLGLFGCVVFCIGAFVARILDRVLEKN